MDCNKYVPTLLDAAIRKGACAITVRLRSAVLIIARASGANAAGAFDDADAELSQPRFG